MSGARRILLVSGSTRRASSNTALLRTAADVAPEGVEAVLYDGLQRLPHFNPDDDPPDGAPPAVVAELRAAIGSAHALLFCTPEYAGELPGSFKNLLDWTVGGGEMDRRPVAWVNVAAPGRGGGAHASLRGVLAYTGSDVVEDACIALPFDKEAIRPDGVIQDPDARARVAEVLATLAAHDSQVL